MDVAKRGMQTVTQYNQEASLVLVRQTESNTPIKLGIFTRTIHIFVIEIKLKHRAVIDHKIKSIELNYKECHSQSSTN